MSWLKSSNRTDYDLKSHTVCMSHTPYTRDSCHTKWWWTVVVCIQYDIKWDYISISLYAQSTISYCMHTTTVRDHFVWHESLVYGVWDVHVSSWHISEFVMYVVTRITRMCDMTHSSHHRIACHDLKSNLANYNLNNPILYFAHTTNTVDHCVSRASIVCVTWLSCVCDITLLILFTTYTSF